MAYTYDDADRVATMTYPSGLEVTYARDAGGNVTTVSIKPPGASAAQTLVSHIDHAPFGPMTAWTYGDSAGTVVTRTRNLDYRVAALQAGTDIDRTYAYTARNNLDTIADSADAGDDKDYDYDPWQRVSRQDVTLNGALVRRYTYDDNGNRLTLQDDGQTTLESYTYAAGSNRLTAQAHWTFEAEAGGKLTAKRDASTGDYAWSLDYRGDPFRRVNEIIGPTQAGGCDHWLVAYNGVHQRVAEYAHDNYSYSKAVNYVHDPAGRLLGEYDQSSGTYRREYVYLNGEAIALVFDDTAGASATRADMGLPSNATSPWYLVNDHLGARQIAIDDQNGTQWDVRYEAFGEVAAVTGNPAAVPLRFPGQEVHVPTGLYYNYFRYYDPATGRYITSDPIGLNGGINAYTYALNNPLRYIDPTGLDVTVSLYPGASGFGHVGIGVNTPNTTGFYPAPDASNFDVVRGQPVPGVMQPDTRTPTGTITIPTTPAQDQAIQDFINQRTQNPGSYDLNDRNCTTTVRDALGAGEVNTPHTILPRTLFDNLRQEFSPKPQ